MSLMSILFLKGSVVLILTAAVSVAFRNVSASLRHFLWCSAFGALVLLMLAPVFAPAWELEVLPSRTTRAPDHGLSVRGVVPGPPERPSSFVETDRGVSWMRRAHELWWLGVAVILAKVLFDLLALSWIRSRGHVVTRPCVTADIRVSPHIRVPMASGFWRPAVLLPEESVDWSESRLEIVLRHELSHLERRDPLTTLLAQLVAALYWPNPLVWLASRKLFLEREKACDEAVLASGTDRVAYAEELVSLASALGGAERSFTAAMADGHGLRARVRDILESRRTRRGLTRPVAWVSALATAALAIPLSVAVLQERPDGTERVRSGRVDAILRQLSSEVPADRTRALWALGELEDRRAVDAVMQALSDPDPEVRGLAAWALGEIKDRSAFATLAERLDDDDPYVREMIIRALGELQDRRALPALRRALEDPSPAVRAAVVWSLGEIDRDDAGTVAGRLVREESADVRREAARQIARRGGDGAMSALVRLLDDSEPRVREEAAKGLGRVGDDRAVEALIASLRDDDHAVRDAATWALDEINPSRGGS